MCLTSLKVHLSFSVMNFKWDQSTCCVFLQLHAIGRELDFRIVVLPSKYDKFMRAEELKIQANKNCNDCLRNGRSGGERRKSRR